MSDFTTGTADFDAGTIGEEIDRDLEASIEGYEPARAGLAKWQRDAFARVMAKVGNQANVTKAALFRRFGEAVAKVPPILAAPATVKSTWTAIDDAGHTVTGGTEVKIPVNGDESRGFVVVGDVEIPPGSEATAGGAVLLQAIEPGEGGNGLSANPTPISATADFVESIVLEGVTDGGVDEEDEDAYLNRMVKEARLFSTSLIVREDFEIDALSFAGVARALCIPAYDADAEEANVPLSYTVVPLTAAGLAPSEVRRDEIQASQEARVPDGVNNFVTTPNYTGIDLEVEVAVLAGFDKAAVQAAVKARLETFLAPANWGLPTVSGDPGNVGGWILVDAVYRNELIAEVSNVAGVDRVVVLKLAKAGGELKTQESIALAGVAPLTEPGDIEVIAA